MGEVTPRELRQLAKQGNTNAMMALGNFYFGEKMEDSDLPEALKWFKMAAREDIPLGMYMAGACHGLLAIQPGSSTTTERVPHWRAAHEWYTTLLRCIRERWTGTEQMQIQDIQERDADIRYHLAVHAFSSSQNAEGMRLLENLNDIRSQVLRAVLEFDTQEKTGQYTEKLFQTFQSLAKDMAYAQKSKDFWERLAYTAFLVAYSNLYSHGVGQPSGKPNRKEALRILEEGERNPTTDHELFQEPKNSLLKTIEQEKAKLKQKYKSDINQSILTTVVLGILALFFPIFWFGVLLFIVLAINSYRTWKAKEDELG